MAEGKRTPLDASLIARVARLTNQPALPGVAATQDASRVAATQEWFGPLTPIAPMAQERAYGRQFDYPVGLNLNYQPRQTEPVSFAQMRALADNYDLLRLLIETRKDQMARLKWTISPIDPKADEDARCEEVENFFKLPDGRHNWQSWLRLLIEELLVLDAPTLLPTMTRGGGLYALEVVDGSTIKPVIDAQGRAPLPPDPAYQQVLHGVPAVEYTRDELIYMPRNIRAHKIYGYSPVEQVIMTVNIGLRRQLHQLQFYTEGNMPDLLFGVPETWTPQNIQDMQAAFDALLAGNTAERRRARFVPGGIKPIDVKEGALTDGTDEWLIRVMCYCFSISPQAFVSMMNRATAETAQEAAIEEGLAPLMGWVKDLIDYVVWKYFGYTDLEFQWEEQDSLDPSDKAVVDDKYLRLGVSTINEVRASRGDDPVEGGDVPMLYTASGAVLLSDVAAMSEEAAKPKPAPVIAAPGQQPAPGDKQAETDDKTDNNSSSNKLAKSKKKALKPINRNRAVVVAARVALRGAIKKTFAQLAPVVAHQIGKAISKVAKTENDQVSQILADLDLTGYAVLVTDSTTILDRVTKDGGAKALLQLGLADDAVAGITDQLNQDALDYAKDRGAEMVGMKWVDGELVDNPNAAWAISDSTRDWLRGLVKDATEQGWSNDRLSTAISDSYAFSDSRADMIARTETAMADVAGNMAAYRLSGVVSGKEWILGSEHDNASDCMCGDNADAGVIGLDDEFPSGDDAAPAHPNCVCDVLPVVADDSTGD